MTDSPMPAWESILSASITSAGQLPPDWQIDRDEMNVVLESYPMMINPYYLGLIRRPDDPLGRQVLPDTAELRDQPASDDPLFEEDQSPVPNLIHRYPDRVVVLVSDRCPIYCRFCLRKRRIGRQTASRSGTWKAAIAYIRKHRHVREVILSGGDPLLLHTDRLHSLLTDIREIPAIETVRIHTRVPSALPQRVTGNLVRMLKGFHPLYINTHFNHPNEITAESSAACALLADGGIPLGCQTVLLKGINDSPETMGRLLRKLIMIRVRPYYIHQLDRVRGTCHFATPPDRGLAIMNRLRGLTSGIGIPQYMIDLPGGGKVPLTPEYIERKERGKWYVRNYQGRIFEYPVTETD